MMRTVRQFPGRVRAMVRDESGIATTEFVLILPVLMIMVLSIFEAGWLMTRSIMLDRALNIAMRDLRIGALPGISHDGLKRRICEDALVIMDCEDVVLIELTPLADLASVPTSGAVCVDRTSPIQPTTTFDPGARSEIMYIRVCTVVDPMFPWVGLGARIATDDSGGFVLASASAFMNEPE